MKNIFLKGTVTVLLLLLVTSLAWGEDNGMPSSPAGVPMGPSVPNLINFQGRLTDASGNPVADGPHTVNFTLWTLPSGGGTVWTENTSQTTSSGLFTHQLGSITAFSSTLFETYDSLYLQIQADGQTILPRIRLTSTPYTRVSQTLETGLGPTITIRSYNVPGFGGNIHMLDEGGNQTLRLEPDFDGTGANLYLYRNVGEVGFLADGNAFGTNEPYVAIFGSTKSVVFDLTGLTTSDASVVLPSDAVNAAEMSNEPGITHRASLPLNTYRAIPSGINALDSIAIAVPSAGYVLVFGALSAAISHTNGTEDEVYFQLMSTPGSIVFDQTGFALYRVPSVLPTSTVISTNYCQYLDLSRVFPVASAGTYKFYLNAQVQAGWDASDVFINAQMSGLFIPTLYGTVDVTNLANAGAFSSNLKPAGDEPFYEVQSITVEEHNARVEAEVAKVKAELEARLQKLEQRFNKQDSGVEK